MFFFKYSEEENKPVNRIIVVVVAVVGIYLEPYLEPNKTTHV